tara:strand:+ start:231 stop:425 length:195 start_codon:yes stop_codon:yes gene_type:complete
MTSLELTIVEIKNGKRFPGEVWLGVENLTIYSYRMSEYGGKISKKRVGVVVGGKNVWDKKEGME